MTRHRPLVGRQITSSDQRRVVWYLGARWECNQRYRDYGPNVMVLRDGIAYKQIR